MAENVEDPEKGEGKAAGVWIFLQSSRPISLALQCRYMGGYLPHGTGSGVFSIPGGAETDGADSTDEAGRKVGLNLGGDADRGGKI